MADKNVTFNSWQKARKGKFCQATVIKIKEITGKEDSENVKWSRVWKPRGIGKIRNRMSGKCSMKLKKKMNKRSSLVKNLIKCFYQSFDSINWKS